MKKYLFLAIVLIFMSCNKEGITFYVSDSTSTTIKSNPLLPLDLPFNLPIIPVTTTATQEYENNKTAPDLLEEVSLNKLSVTITSPATEDFSPIESIHITIKKSDDSAPVEIAYLDNINSSAKTIDLTCTDANLVEYLREDSYKLDTKVKVKEYLTHDVDIQIDLKFKIIAKLL